MEGGEEAAVAGEEERQPEPNFPPATPPPVPAAALAGMAGLDPLSRVGTPSRERKELWELLNLPEVRVSRVVLCARARVCSTKTN